MHTAILFMVNSLSVCFCSTRKPKKSGVVGGTCQGRAKPAWQALVGNPKDGVRDIPDVSLLVASGSKRTSGRILSESSMTRKLHGAAAPPGLEHVVDPVPKFPRFGESARLAGHPGVDCLCESVQTFHRLPLTNARERKGIGVLENTDDLIRYHKLISSTVRSSPNTGPYHVHPRPGEGSLAEEKVAMEKRSSPPRHSTLVLLARAEGRRIVPPDLWKQCVRCQVMSEFRSDVSLLPSAPDHV
jgi:hypothetical protein